MATPANAPPTSQPSHQGLPSITSLTNGLPPSQQQQHNPYQPQQRSPDQQSLADSTRDSGTWPQPQSKHNSANSGLQVHTLLNPDESTLRYSVPSTPQSGNVRNSTASGGSGILPSINQGFHQDGNRDSYASMDSRRSSVDSRMHQGFGNLNIYNNNNQPGSPYESHSQNGSHTSLAQSLRRPNGPGGPMSPLSGRSSLRGHPAPRIAPPIAPAGQRAADPTAPRPTPGQAWAFPDMAIPEERRGSDSGDSSLSHEMSRANSFAASSMRSSIFSNDSQMPQGQRRFDDETTHHHSMQHRTIQSLQNENMQGQGVGNYSRTPELRVSHKLAERKRRSEMKDLFEDLNKAVPSNGGAKASKWEILTKAIDHIKNTQMNERQLHHEVTRLQRDVEYSRDAHKENEMLKTEIQVMHQHLRRLDPNAPHVYGHLTSQLQQSNSTTANGAPNISLPPLPPTQPPPPVPFNSGVPPTAAAMQGVEYGGYGR